jgi:hypothetical protein
MRGRGNGSSHGFGTRCGGALLGLGDALIVAKPLAVGLGGRERGLGAGRDCIALVLGDSGEDVDRELGGSRVVAANVLRSISIAMNARSCGPRPA